MIRIFNTDTNETYLRVNFFVERVVDLVRSQTKVFILVDSLKLKSKMVEKNNWRMNNERIRSWAFNLHNNDNSYSHNDNNNNNNNDNKNNKNYNQNNNYNHNHNNNHNNIVIIIIVIIIKIIVRIIIIMTSSKKNDEHKITIWQLTSRFYLFRTKYFSTDPFKTL